MRPRVSPFVVLTMLVPVGVVAQEGLPVERSVVQDTARGSPGWARYMGGFVTGSATLALMMSTTWDDPDEIGDLEGYAYFVLGTAAGTMLTTALWEKPDAKIVLGAAIGAAPLLAALAFDVEDDDAAGLFLTLSWIGAPLGAALGQR